MVEQIFHQALKNRDPASGGKRNVARNNNPFLSATAEARLGKRASCWSGAAEGSQRTTANFVLTGYAHLSQPIAVKLALYQCLTKSSVFDLHHCRIPGHGLLRALSTLTKCHH